MLDDKAGSRGEVTLWRYLPGYHSNPRSFEYTPFKPPEKIVHTGYAMGFPVEGRWLPLAQFDSLLADLAEMRAALQMLVDFNPHDTTSINWRLAHTLWAEAAKALRTKGTSK